MKEKETKRKNNRELQRFDKHLSSGLTLIRILCLHNVYNHNAAMSHNICKLILSWNCKLFFCTTKRKYNQDCSISEHLYNKNIWILNIELLSNLREK